MEFRDIVIIGGGVSGLSLAHYCSWAGFKPLVIEKSERLGGTFHSERVDIGASDFWFELGAHTCYSSYGNFARLLEDCHALDLIERREKVGYKLLVDNRVKSIPSELNYLELPFAVPRIFFLKKQGESIKSYYSKIVGQKNYERIFKPALSAVICQDCDDFPADLLFQKRSRRQGIPRQYTLSGGLQTAADTLASQKNITIKKQTAANGISFNGRTFSVSCSDGTTLESACLALAPSAQVSAELLSQSFPEISRLLSQIHIAVVDSIGVVVRKESLKLGIMAGIIPASDLFFSVVTRDVVPHDLYRAFTFHFKPGSGDRDSRLRRISEVLGTGPERIEHVAEKQNLVPSLRVGHVELVEKIERLLAGKLLLLTGNYFTGVAVEDCVSRSLKEFHRANQMLK